MPKATQIETHFLGWDSPLLVTATDFLLQKYVSNDRFDGSTLICVLPTQRSSHRLAELLQETAHERHLQWVSPRFLTVGELPEQLYEPSRQTALEFEQTLAWAKVLRSTPQEQLRVLVPASSSAGPSASQSIESWLELASTIRRLQTELATSQLRFREVADACESESEIARWQLLDQLATRYQCTLEEAQLVDPDTARFHAMAQGAIQCSHEVVMIGTSDINNLLVAMLHQCKAKITSLIAAPESYSNRFDQWGCVQTERWLEHPIPINDDQLIPAGDLSDVAVTAAGCVAQYHQQGFDHVVIGSTDTSQVGPVEMELRGIGQTSHRQLGWTISATSAGKLLGLVARHARRQTWQTLAALVRHGMVAPQITRSLKTENEVEWLTQLDHLLSNHYPTGLETQLTKLALEQTPLAVKVKQWCVDWLAPFNADPKPLSQWCEILRQWLPAPPEADSVESVTELRTCRAIEQTGKLLTRFADLNDQLDPIVSGAIAIEMIRGRLADLRMVLDPEKEQIPIVGWLDLALDDSDAMVVMGLNHPYVPSATTSDPFLPGSLRSQLKMADNERRFARDVYAMHLMLSTRKQTHFIVGKKAGDGSATPPSRLLAAAEKEKLAARVRMLYGKDSQQPPFGRSVNVQHQWDVGPARTQLPIPDLRHTAQYPPYSNQANVDHPPQRTLVSVMSVTAFRDYLTCPYRFYLRHVLGIKPLEDSRDELAANQFGDLVHGAVEAFGESSAKDETNPSKIEAALIGHLHDYADAHYGPDASTSVRLQVTQAERRLAAVARQQAKRIHEGWIIHATEASVSEKSGAVIEVPSGTMAIRGRFDRIDHHPATGRWAILDYKTHGQKPEKKHLKKKKGVEKWIDLQLPLYRRMIPFLGIDVPPDEVELGYFNVSEKESETKINLAKFTPAQLAQAEQLIHQCITGVLAKKFEPTDEPLQFDDYGMILQTGAFPIAQPSSGNLDANTNEVSL